MASEAPHLFRAYQRPKPEAGPAIELLRRLYRALSRRARGEDGEDPFQLRQELIGLTLG